MRYLFLIGCFFSFITHVLADLRLPAMFSDGMILQQESNAPVWGWTKPHQQVQLNFAGQTLTTTANSSGRFAFKLAPLKASFESREMIIKEAEQTFVIKDVLVGEVWFCSGQSNMLVTLGRFIRRPRDSHYQELVKIMKEEISSAHDPFFRELKVPIATSHFEPLTNFLGSWKAYNSSTAAIFAATPTFFAKHLRAQLKVPVGVIVSARGSQRVESFTPSYAFRASEDYFAYYQREMDAIKLDIAEHKHHKVLNTYKERLEAWRIEANQAVTKGIASPKPPRMPPLPKDNPRVPSTLFNSMIHPVIPYGIKGFLWYQGESNSEHYPKQYSFRLKTMIQAWRERWGNKTLPFYFCQLSSYSTPNKAPLHENPWAEVSDQLRRTLSVPNTGMAVLHDIGQTNDFHPHNKFDVGKRLSLWALSQTYGLPITPHSGPLIKSYQREDSKVILTFDHVGAGLMVGKKNLNHPTEPVDQPLQRFQICGEDQTWHWATANITSKNTVEVFHPDVQHPVEVRYAYSNNPIGANLYNQEGLPAALFKLKL